MYRSWYDRRKGGATSDPHGRTRRAALLTFAGGAAAIVAACAARQATRTVTPTGHPGDVTGAFAYSGHVLTPLGYGDLAGWEHDNHAEALAAFARSSRLIRDSSVLAGVSRHAWRTAGAAADGALAGAKGSRGEDVARSFFESRFQPVVIEDLSRSLFTGYFEPVLEGSRVQEGVYQTPLYAVPPERKSRRRKAPSRKEINEGALEGRGLELFWVADPVEAFFLEIQGSGRIRLPDGSMTRVGYAGQNGHGYYAIGRWLVEEEIIPREEMSAEAIKTWLRDNPEAGVELMQRNPSYVFFRELEALDPSLGPLGAMEVPLTDLRSVAVDRSVHPLGCPVWLETELAGVPFHRLMVAQDVGGAIKGAQRADIYCGSGDRAGLMASAQSAGGRIVTLVPRTALAEWVASGPSVPVPEPEAAPEAAPGAEPGAEPFTLGDPAGTGAGAPAPGEAPLPPVRGSSRA